MTLHIPFLLYGAVLLVFGVFLSAAFCGIAFSRKNILRCLLLCLFCGALQIGLYLFFPTDFLWKIYPVITHLPLLVFLMVLYRKNLACSAAAICTAYLCCQPSKWFGLLVFHISGSENAEYFTRIAVLLFVAVFVFYFLADTVAEIFSKDSRSVCIFGLTPFVYYLYDYSTVVYKSFFADIGYIIAEFLPFFLVIVYMLFCVVYFREYEKKSDAQRKEHIIMLTVDEMKKELEAVNRSQHQLRLMRHDMRLLLNSLSMAVENGDKETTHRLISGYIDQLDTTVVKKYCSNTTLNYIFSSFADRCEKADIPFDCRIGTDSIKCDEVMLSTLISNALDNAINAQLPLPAHRRSVSIMLKERSGKLLISVKNPFAAPPVFVDGVPVSDRENHGYGTRSIIYLSERMGGNCQFKVENNLFVLRVII